MSGSGVPTCKSRDAIRYGFVVSWIDNKQMGTTEREIQTPVKSYLLECIQPVVTSPIL